MNSIEGQRGSSRAATNTIIFFYLRRPFLSLENRAVQV